MRISQQVSTNEEFRQYLTRQWRVLARVARPQGALELGVWHGVEEEVTDGIALVRNRHAEAPVDELTPRYVRLVLTDAIRKVQRVKGERDGTDPQFLSRLLRALETLRARMAQYEQDLTTGAASSPVYAQRSSGLRTKGRTRTRRSNG